MLMVDYADLEIRLYRYDTAKYALDLRFNHPDSDADVRIQQSDTPPLAQFDLNHLRTLELDPTAYGAFLTQALFTDPQVQTIFEQAHTAAQSLDVSLRFRFLIGAGTPELHYLRWETLHIPGTESNEPLLTNTHILFSRYLSSSDWRPIRLRPKTDLQALIAIANPTNLERYAPGGATLAAIDIESELAQAHEHMQGITTTVLSQHHQAPPNLTTIIKTLREGYDILYIVAHGATINGEPFLWLEDEDGNAAVTNGRDLTQRIKELQAPPRLVIFAACQSGIVADMTREKEDPDDPDVTPLHASLPVRLVEAGVPAVIAMQGSITMKTAGEFMSTFFAELQRDGMIDRAMATARQIVLDRPDWWMPVLFMRLKSGRIWYIPGFGEDGQDFEKWPALIRNIQRGNCTPIIGAHLHESLVDSIREIARNIAQTYNFPLEPHEQEEFPPVAQYLSISQDSFFPREELLEYLRRNIITRYGEHLPDSSLPLSDLFTAAWKHQSSQQPNDPYAVLAAQPFSLYITASFTNLLAEALKAAGKDPQIEICRWNEDLELLPSVYDNNPDYQPSPEQPLIFHLFGHMDNLDTLVLTEDDYFDFLINISVNKDRIPIVVRHALTDTGLLFLGFHLQDWDFRVLYRTLMNQEGRSRRKRYAHVAAQINPSEDRTLDPNRARSYLETYFEGADINVFWGSAEDFMEGLNKQLQETVETGTRSRGRERRVRRR
jgi:hypothetical protein